MMVYNVLIILNVLNKGFFSLSVERNGIYLKLSKNSSVLVFYIIDFGFNLFLCNFLILFFFIIMRYIFFSVNI